MLPVLAGVGGSPKAALIVDVLVDLFGDYFQRGIEMSSPERSRPIADPTIWELGDTFALLEREASAKRLLTALSFIEARIKAEMAPSSSSLEEGVAFAGQCCVLATWQAAGSEGQKGTRLDAGHPFSS